ncbi:hypothetical protein AX15_005056 [Amanita polypyramis BW_CC]|nr:hypothetical protein AX15_005056 [Amanita polypyramis BW_CC]
MQYIDGSILEGGGQILRNSIALSALLRRPIVVENIRKERTPPGLKNQHRSGLELAATITCARLTGAFNLSTRVVFEPGYYPLQHAGLVYKADAVTAGSTMLLLQSALPILLFAAHRDASVRSYDAEIELILKGGTNAEQAPQIDYTQNVFIPFLRRHILKSGHTTTKNDDQWDGVRRTSATVEMVLERRGYYPKGGGVVHVRVKPLPPGETLHPVSLLSRGRVVSVRGIAHYADLPTSVGTGMVRGALEQLRTVHLIASDATRISTADTVSEAAVQIECRREPRSATTGAGSGVVLWAELEGGGFVGGSAVGRKGIDPEHVGARAAEELINSLKSQSCIDEWLQDQMAIFMALAQGKSEICCGLQELSLHTRTAMWVAEELTGAKFELERNETGLNIMHCHGIGLKSGIPLVEDK